MTNKVSNIIFTLCCLSLTFISGCDYSTSNDVYLDHDEQESKRYVKYMRDNKLSHRAHDYMGNLVIHQYPFYGKLRDLNDITIYNRIAKDDGLSEILCDKNSFFMGNNEQDNALDPSMGNVDQLFYICDYWKNNLGDQNVKLGYLFMNRDKKEDTNGELYPSRVFVNDVYFIDNYENIADTTSYSNINNLSSIFQKIQQSHITNRDYVAPLAMGFSLFTPYIMADTDDEMLTKLLYENNILPVVSIGSLVPFQENTVVADLEKANILVDYYRKRFECANGVNCVISNSSYFVRNPYAVVVGSTDINGNRLSNSFMGPNLWISTIGDPIIEKKAVTQVTMAIANMLIRNNTLSIEQIKYILATTADSNKTILRNDETNFGGWQKNGGGFRFANEIGFGLLDFYQAINLAENCDFNEKCNMRRLRPNFKEYIKSYNCSPSFARNEGKYGYVCRIYFTDQIELENLLLDIDNVRFEETKDRDYCARMGTIKGIATRIPEIGYENEVINVLRELSISISSSQTTNKYVVKAENDNFLGTGYSTVDFKMNNNEPIYITVNHLYGEEFDEDRYIDIHFNSVCKLDFSDYAVGALVEGYSY